MPTAHGTELRITPTFRPARWDRFVEKAYRKLYSDVLKGVVAGEVRRAIVEHMAGDAPQVGFAGEGGTPDSGQVAIGNIAALNDSSKIGQWRFGWWFNLEWGREFPRRGQGWLFQQNPGPAIAPGDESDRPPGATLADVRRGLKLGGVVGGGAAVSASLLADPLGVRHGTNASREWEKAARQARHEAQSAKTSTQHLKAQLRAGRLARGVRVGSRGGLHFQTPQNAQAPIRSGLYQGLESAQARVPDAVRTALRAARGNV